MEVKSERSVNGGNSKCLEGSAADRKGNGADDSNAAYQMEEGSSFEERIASNLFRKMEERKRTVRLRRMKFRRREKENGPRTSDGNETYLVEGAPSSKDFL